MKDEMTSMSQNKVWSFVDFPDGYRPIWCKWVFKTKCDAKGQVERSKVRLVAKSYSQREGIDLKLHQMNVRITFLNTDLVEDVYMFNLLALRKLVRNTWFVNSRNPIMV